MVLTSLSDKRYTYTLHDAEDPDNDRSGYLDNILICGSNDEEDENGCTRITLIGGGNMIPILIGLLNSPWGKQLEKAAKRLDLPETNKLIQFIKRRKQYVHTVPDQPED